MSALISEAYLAEQRRLHAAPQGYGGKGCRWAAPLRELAARYGCRSLLDYGCGQGSLCAALAGSGLALAEYDPAIPGKDALPAPADLLVCTDVLEHVEPDRIWAVMAHLASLTQRIAFFAIALQPSNKRLANGQQAHLLLRSPEWWRTLCRAHGFAILREDLPPNPAKHWLALLERERW